VDVITVGGFSGTVDLGGGAGTTISLGDDPNPPTVIGTGSSPYIGVTYSQNGFEVMVVGNGGTVALFAGDQSDTLIGYAGTSESNTFVLNGGTGGGTSTLVHIENFNPAHDTIDLPASIYAGLGTAPVVSGPNANVLVLANDAAASAYNGTNAAILVVGSGSNADLFYYTPHDANHGNQAHAYQLATVVGSSASDAASHVSFANLASVIAHS